MVVSLQFYGLSMAVLICKVVSFNIYFLSVFTNGSSAIALDNVNQKDLQPYGPSSSC